jgi:signal transduction histidine kinase
LAALESNELSDLDLIASLNESITSVGPILERTNVQVSTQFPSTPAMISSNGKQLEMVWVNLLKNAAEAIEGNPNPKAVRRIRVSIEDTQTTYTISVQDSGTGIAPENLGRMFEYHFTTKGKEGTGLGLHLTKQIIEALGGKISVDSPPNEGARFRVQLPKKSN